jgi:hypothetical protein
MPRSIMALLLAMVSAVAAPAFPAFASEAATPVVDPVGDWIGILDVGSPLRVALHVKRTGDKLTATADSLDEDAFDIAVQAIVADGDRLNFEVQSIQGRYAGSWDPAKQSYVGTWTLGGRVLPLEFVRGIFPSAAAGQ